MKIEEAIKAVESEYKLVSEVGFTGDSDFGRIDMSRAPNGHEYVTLVSGGIKDDNSPVPALFTSDDDAIESWLYAVWDYAHSIGEAEDLKIYWREKPVFFRHQYTAIDQAAMMGRPDHRANINLSLCYVYSKLVISKE